MADEYMAWGELSASHPHQHCPGHFKNPSGDAIPPDSGWVTLKIIDIFRKFIVVSDSRVIESYHVS